MNIAAYLLAFLMMAAAARAESPPGARAFQTADAAAVLALSDALRQAGRQEFAGGIVRCDSAYFYTAPQSSGSHDEFNVALKFPRSCSLAAIYHTHPRGAHSLQFSAIDVCVARRLALPSFIADTSGAIRVFAPGMLVNAAERESGSVVTVAAGTADGIAVERQVNARFVTAQVRL